MTDKEKLAQLEKENAELKAKMEKAIALKVSPKGAVQLNGLRRFPITFYKGEWKQIFDMKDKIEEFIKVNDGQLSSK